MSGGHELIGAPRVDHSAAGGADIKASIDPLRYCVMTTVALLAWLVGPALMVVAMSALGLIAYGRALGAGLTRSRCVLGDTRLVMVYLLIAFGAGVASIGYRLLAAGR